MPARLGRSGESTHVYPGLNTRVIAGGAAGALTCTGIKATDTLVAVQNVAAAGANLASEFTVTANTITNTGGTNTTGMTLLVIWYTAAINQ